MRLISLGEQSVNIKENFYQEMTFELGHKKLVRLTVRNALGGRGKYKNYSDCSESQVLCSAPYVFISSLQ